MAFPLPTSHTHPYCFPLLSADRHLMYVFGLCLPIEVCGGVQSSEMHEGRSGDF